MYLFIPVFIYLYIYLSIYSFIPVFIHAFIFLYLIHFLSSIRQIPVTQEFNNNLAIASRHRINTQGKETQVETMRAGLAITQETEE